MIENIVNSAVGTTIAEVVTLPICTIKTNYQNSSEKSIITVVKNLYKNGGISSFYRASPAAISSQVFSTSSKYVLYRYLEDKNIQYSNKVLNGMASGIISSLVTHPVDFVKIHWQMKTPVVPELKKNGISILYRGYSKTFGKVCVGSSMFLPLYDYTNEKINNPFYASLTSSIISTTIIHPLDYLKTRQIYSMPLYSNNSDGYTSILKIVYANIKQSYKGLSLNLMRIVPHFTILMTTIEFLK